MAWWKSRRRIILFRSIPGEFLSAESDNLQIGNGDAPQADPDESRFSVQILSQQRWPKANRSSKHIQISKGWPAKFHHAEVRHCCTQLLKVNIGKRRVSQLDIFRSKQSLLGGTCPKSAADRYFDVDNGKFNLPNKNKISRIPSMYLSFNLI